MENDDNKKEGEETPETNETTDASKETTEEQPPVKLTKSGKFSVPGSGLDNKYGGGNSFGGNSGQGTRATKRTGPRGDK